jgi:hypothetical protein
MTVTDIANKCGRIRDRDSLLEYSDVADYFHVAYDAGARADSSGCPSADLEPRYSVAQ